MNRDHLASGMGIWFEQQLLDLLRAVALAGVAVPAIIDTPEMRAYTLGYQNAITAIAAAIGVDDRLANPVHPVHSPSTPFQPVSRPAPSTLLP